LSPPLEPFVEEFKEYDENYPMVCYELDAKVKPVITFNQYQTLFMETLHNKQSLPSSRLL